jgi:hypothetical protein
MPTRRSDFSPGASPCSAIRGQRQPRPTPPFGGPGRQSQGSESAAAFRDDAEYQVTSAAKLPAIAAKTLVA